MAGRRLTAAALVLTVATMRAGDADSVAMSGGLIVIGNSYDSSNRGLVSIHRASDGVLLKQFFGSGSDDYLGIAVAIDGDTVVAGAWDWPNEGFAKVYRTPDGGDTWTTAATLTASDGEKHDYFGRSVAVAGDTVFVGASGDDDGGTNSGSVYVFRTTDGGATYDEVQTLRASSPRNYAYFGNALAADGDTLVIGAYSDNSYKGAVYVFRKSFSTYAQVARLTGSGVAEDDEFGTSVGVSGDTIVVGTEYTDAAFVYRTSDGGATWAAVTTLEGSDDFGQSVAIDGDTIVIGASGGDATYVYRTSDGGATYAEVVKLTAPRKRTNSGTGPFGEAVAVSGGAVSVAAYGATYVYGATERRLLRRAAPRALRPRRRLEDATAATAAPTAMAGTAREETSFGASFMYRNDYETRLFFASNTGAGLFELILPVVVPDDCWNADKDWEDHVQCSSSVAALVRRSDAAEAASNDGLNCPLGGGPAISRYSSDAPTITPVPSSSPYPTTAAPTASLAPTTPSPTTAQPSPTALHGRAVAGREPRAHDRVSHRDAHDTFTLGDADAPAHAHAHDRDADVVGDDAGPVCFEACGGLRRPDRGGRRRAVSGRPRFSGTRGGHGLRAGHLRARFRETAAPDDGLRRDHRPRGDVPPEQRGRHLVAVSRSAPRLLR